MVYIPEDFDLSNYERQFTSYGSIDTYYPKVIIKNHLREKVIELVKESMKTDENPKWVLKQIDKLQFGKVKQHFSF